MLNNMTMYNLYLDTVAEVAPMPEPRYRFGYGVVGDKLYVFGGFSAIEDFAETAPLPSRTMIFSFTTVCVDPPPPLLCGCGSLLCCLSLSHLLFFCDRANGTRST